MSYLSSLSILVMQHTKRHYNERNESAITSEVCPQCSAGGMYAIAVGELPENISTFRGDGGFSMWLLCPSCGHGAFLVRSDFFEAMYPKAAILDVPDHLNGPVETTWREAIDCFSVNAYTASTLMCRKIIFYMAVDKGLPSENEKGFAPTFAECINHLVSEGFITSRQKDDWVDSIRVLGNVATHEVEPLDKNAADKALKFTYHLLQMIYTMPSSAASS